MSEPFGLSSRYLISASGVHAFIPYRVASQGMVLTRPSLDLAVLILPIASAEDPRFSPWLTRTGLYRIEDLSGQIARVGQGIILDRVRRHRARPMVFPHRLMAATALGRAWTTAQRCYLEERLANHWLAAGHALASSMYMRENQRLPQTEKVCMELVLGALLDLLSEGLRLEEKGNPMGFQPHHPSPGASLLSTEAIWLRRFAPGTQLEFRSAEIFALALARREDVVLLPGSLVHLTPTSHVGALFRRQHHLFLTTAGTVPVSATIGRTQVLVGCPTAASLIKHATAGRLHNGDRWRPRAGGKTPHNYHS